MLTEQLTQTRWGGGESLGSAVRTTGVNQKDDTGTIYRRRGATEVEDAIYSEHVQQHTTPDRPCCVTKCPPPPYGAEKGPGGVWRLGGSSAT